MTRRRLPLVLSLLTVLLSLAPGGAWAQPKHGLFDLWKQGKTAFGVFVPNENPQRFERGQPPPKAIYTEAGAKKLAANPSYDYLFLNLEGSYDVESVKAMVRGLQSMSGRRPALLVRIPTIERDGVEVTRARVKEILAAGADGITLPHIRSVEEARTALGFFTEAKANVWSPANPSGTVIAMLMVEDPGAVAVVDQIADLKRFSVLACGIGSLTQAMGGDRAGAEAGNQKVLAASKRVGIPNMLTANSKDVEQRVREGFLGLLGQGTAGDEMIAVGRKAAGR